ncbi:MAG TPA: tagaturonate epimerase family protein [Candidatus Methylacidiphilales bacterium]|nr:tagaturonate epimerase family protein [Candidatus Methylacidiphilales bacterium]
MKTLEKFSLGMGDRFAHQGRAQLQAVVNARARGIGLAPVWNKSNREHTIVKSEPISVRREAEAAVAALGWTGPWHVDADHINLANVDRFIEASDFYTIDVADFTGRAAEPAEIGSFLRDSSKLTGALAIPGLAQTLTITRAEAENTARKFLWSMQEAGRIHRHIAKLKGADFIAEVSVDETDQPQSPAELLLILFMLAREKVPAQTIAPKFTGRFNKGVDYVGDLAQFEKEFEEDLCVVQFAIRHFNLPETLKLSVHSGSDKFSLYPIINRLLRKHGAGVHVKTAGTTWLEEVIGLAESGGDALALAKDIYLAARNRADELIKPYAPVVDIDMGKLPSPAAVRAWTSADFCAALRHDRTSPRYNAHFRQFIHVAFKIAAEMGPRYLQALAASEAIIARNVTENLFARHIVPLFA